MSGVQTIEPPFPTGDNTPRSGYVWSFYSKEQYMELVRFVYTLALEEYLTLTKTVFSRFSADLFISKLAPCKLVGNLQFDPCTGDRGAPILRWHLMALPRTSQNIIDIEYRDNDSTEKLFSEIINNRKEYRPEMGEKGIITSGEVLSLSCFKPVTKTVFKWLASELKSLGWIENYRI